MTRPGIERRSPGPLSLHNIKAIKAAIFQILKTWMGKGTKLSEFVKGEITALKRVGKSQREISKAMGRSKTVIYNNLKSTNKKSGTRKPTGRQEKLSEKVKKKSSSTSKILKPLVDTP